MNITLYDGRNCSFDGCLGCEVYDGRVDLSGSIIYQNELFRVMQDTENPIVGMYVISPKRHVRTLNDLYQEEHKELYRILITLRQGMEDVLGIHKTSLIQEDGGEGMHFHPWFFPWHEWMGRLDMDGSDTEKIRKIMAYSREHMVSPAQTQKIHDAVQKMRKIFER